MKFGSVCSGIEAASVAWHPLGWQSAFYAEIEPFPSAVLTHNYPDVPNLGDITKFRNWPDAAIDVLVGGTPCQSFSVAGLRKGLADPRGNLALVYLGILDRYRPAWMVWENVPGVLSSNEGKDFGAFLGGLAELGYGFAYRVLDAQYFGLAQRRKRVFVVGHLRDWRRAAAVLFERESLSGNPPPSRKAGQRIAGPIAGCSNGGGANGPGRSADDADSLVARLDWETETFIPEVSNPLLAKGNDSFDDTLQSYVAHALRADGFDASEDGTGCGTPLVPICFDETQITSAENRCNPQPGDPSHPLSSQARPSAIVQGVALRGREGGATAELTGDVMTALRTGGGGGDKPHVLNGWHVRRLTPTECERLQGFPDGYTEIPYRGKIAADGPRYKALGNSMATRVMRWIGERIEIVNAIPERIAS